jgi:hypothetical protein
LPVADCGRSSSIFNDQSQSSILPESSSKEEDGRANRQERKFQPRVSAEHAREKSDAGDNKPQQLKSAPHHARLRV